MSTSLSFCKKYRKSLQMLNSNYSNQYFQKKIYSFITKIHACIAQTNLKELANLSFISTVLFCVLTINLFISAINFAEKKNILFLNS